MTRMFAPLLALVLFVAGAASAAPAAATPPAAAPSAAAQPAPAPPDLNVIHTALIGTWQSVDDTRFTRELDGDGRAIDRYEGDNAGATFGRWMLFLGSKPPVGTTAARAFQPGVVYLRLDQNGDVLLFALAGLSRSDMKMVYLERGNLLSFVRLK